MTNRGRLKRAIDNMERTEICLEIFDRTFDQAREALKLALNHQVSNRGTADAFYTCYTMRHGEMPEWVKLAEMALAAMEDAGR